MVCKRILVWPWVSGDDCSKGLETFANLLMLHFLVVNVINVTSWPLGIVYAAPMVLIDNVLLTDTC